MTVDQALAELKKLADEKVRARNYRDGAGDRQFGVKHGDIRKLAKKIKADHALALELWETGNLDARLLATLVMEPEKLSKGDMDRLVRSTDFVQVADWLGSYVLKEHPDKESLRQEWMADDDRWAARAGWSLTSGRVARDPEGIDVKALLDRIESELADAEPEVQWTMNSCLANVGIHHPEHRKRAIAVGEAKGVYRDYPVSKGCTSPFAPIWIEEMVKRQG